MKISRSEWFGSREENRNIKKKWVPQLKISSAIWGDLCGNEVQLPLQYFFARNVGKCSAYVAFTHFYHYNITLKNIVVTPV